MVRTRIGGSVAAAVVLVAGVMIVGVSPPTASAAGTVTMTASKTLSENFDTLVSSGTGTLDTNTPAGVQFLETSTNANTTYTASAGGSNAGDTYSFGTGTSTERALGQVRSTGLVSTLGYQFTNGTAETITDLTVAYTGEQWRLGTAGRADGMAFDYSTSAASLGAGSYTAVAGLGFSSPNTTTVGALDGNATGNRVTVSGTINGLSVPPGATITLRWTDADPSGADDGLAIDDLTVTANPPVSNQPVVATCPSSIVVVPSGTGSQAISATDADGTVANAAITSAPVTGITLGPVTPATAVGGTLTSTLEVGLDAPPGTTNVTITFTNGDTPTAQTATCTIAVITSVRIRDIQGAGHLSPLVGRSVSDVPGIVTGKRSNGFYLQDPAPDADPATSEGIFVFTSSAPTVAVGDSVLVGGAVAEFRPTSSTGPNLTTTEITGPTVNVVSPGNPLPAATVVGTGGRTPPAKIDDDPSASVEDTGHVFDVTKNAIDFFESMEGMLVTVNSSTVVDGSSTTVSNGEIPVLPGGVTAANRSPRGAALVGPYVGVDTELSDANAGRVFLDDEVLKLLPGPNNVMPAANVGDTVATATGPLDYSFGNFKVEVTTTPAVTTVPLPREVGAAAVDGGITVATYNVENLAPTDSQTKFDGLAGQIVGNLRSPDLVIVEEIQDNNGTSTAGTTAADQTWAKLIAAITAAGGPTYEYRQIDPQASTDGGAPGGNIRVGFLFRTDRGLEFVDRPGGNATTPVAVEDVDGTPQLSTSPGRIEPGDPAWNASRKPLVGEFTFAGRTIFVVGNHFNSKGGDDPLYGRFQPPSRSSEIQRHQQATLVHDFVEQITAIDPSAEVIVAGDLNDFETSETLDILEGSTLVNMFDTLPANEQYDYVFEGNAQTLDHILVTPTLKEAGRATFDVVHVNAEYGDQLSDHDPELLSLDFTPPPGGRLLAVGPVRVLDTRVPGGTRLRPGEIGRVDIDDAPADSVGVISQVTVVDPSGDGWVKVFPCDQPEPNASTINYKAGTGAWAGQVTTSIGDGALCATSFAEVDLVVDLEGFLVSGDNTAAGDADTAGYAPVAPYRLVDTREGRGGTRLRAGRIMRVDPTTTPGWPSGPVTAAVVQLTAVDGPLPGFLRAFPCDEAMPETSNVNTRGAGQSAYSSLTTVPLGADGSFCVYTYSATDVVVDVNGAWATDATERLLPAVAPFRVVDTRSGQGGTRLAGGATLRIPAAAWGGGTAAILNVVAVNASAPGFLTLYDCATPRPTVSNVNFPAAGGERDGSPTSNAAQIKVAPGGELCVTSYAGSAVDVVVDVSGQVIAAPG